MNVEQLERIRTMISSMIEETKADTGGTGKIVASIIELDKLVQEELKNLVWARYLEDVA